MPNQGIVIINWKNVSDEKIQKIISSLYSDNRGAILGMNYYEVGPETADLVKKIPEFLEGKYKRVSSPTQQTLF
jgi:hypothetical protein